MNVKMEDLKKQLEKHNINPSYHRLKILHYLMKHRIHPTVDRIYKDLSKEIPTLSKTTIYTTLKLFIEKGIVRELFVDENEMRYEYADTPHGHFRCIKCGKIYDVEITVPLNKDTIQGHKILEQYLCFKGICKECLKNTQ